MSQYILVFHFYRQKSLLTQKRSLSLPIPNLCQSYTSHPNKLAPKRSLRTMRFHEILTPADWCSSDQLLWKICKKTQEEYISNKKKTIERVSMRVLISSQNAATKITKNIAKMSSSFQVCKQRELFRYSLANMKLWIFKALPIIDQRNLGTPTIGLPRIVNTTPVVGSENKFPLHDTRDIKIRTWYQNNNL